MARTGITDAQLAVLNDWAEQRLLLCNVHAQLEKVLLLVLPDPPVARAVKEALQLIEDRPTVKQRLNDPGSLTRDVAGIAPEFAAASRDRGPSEKHPVYEPLPDNVMASSLAGPRSNYGPSHREVVMLEMVARGMSNQEIGDELFLHVETVRSALGVLMRRYQAGSRTAVVAMALRKGWIV